MEILLPTKENRFYWLNMRCHLWTYHIRTALYVEQREVIRQIAAGNRAAFLAKEEGEYCGFIEVSLRETAPGCQTSPVGFIEGWLVEEGYQKKGIGTALIQKGEEWARQKGCSEMASDTTGLFPKSPAAHAALGYKTALKERDHYYFYKQL